MITLHLVTQRDQPYGSTRTCCEECGAMVPPAGSLEAKDYWFTIEPKTYESPPEGYKPCSIPKEFDSQKEV